jgi:hypothetical protein
VGREQVDRQERLIWTESRSFELLLGQIDDQRQRKYNESIENARKRSVKSDLERNCTLRDEDGGEILVIEAMEEGSDEGSLWKTVSCGRIFDISLIKYQYSVDKPTNFSQHFLHIFSTARLSHVTYNRTLTTTIDLYSRMGIFVSIKALR